VTETQTMAIIGHAPATPFDETLDHLGRAVGERGMTIVALIQRKAWLQNAAAGPCRSSCADLASGPMPA
jgi:hypothetical protein